MTLFDSSQMMSIALLLVIHYLLKVECIQSLTEVKILIKDVTQEMLERGVIEPSSDSWFSPVILVSKSGSGKRFCVDFRDVNRLTSNDVYPLTRIKELFDSVSGTKHYTNLDVKDAYWHITVREHDRDRGTLSDGENLYRLRECLLVLFQLLVFSSISYIKF